MSEIRVIAVTLASKTAPLVVMATATSNALHIISVESLPKSVKELADRLADLEVKAGAAGAELVIEDPTGFFGSIGRTCRLDDKDATGRPVLVRAMERYTSLSAVNAITYPTESKSALIIQQSIYNVKQSDRGQVMYEIDWETLKDTQRVFLLCIHAAMCQNVFQEGFFSQMLGYLAPSFASSPNSEPLNYEVKNKGIGGRRLML